MPSSMTAFKKAGASLEVVASFAPDGRLILSGAAALAGTATYAASGHLVLSGATLIETFANLSAVATTAGLAVYAVIELELPERGFAMSLRSRMSRMMTLIVPIRSLAIDLFERSTEGELFERTETRTAGKR